jgi:hypothetical protein
MRVLVSGTDRDLYCRARPRIAGKNKCIANDNAHSIRNQIAQKGRTAAWFDQAGYALFPFSSSRSQLPSIPLLCCWLGETWDFTLDTFHSNLPRF